MNSAIEETIKALTEFESALDSAKDEAEAGTKKLIKDATDWAESARTSAISKAQQIASDRIEKAKADAEKEATSIRKKGESALGEFEGSISKKKGKASERVVARLLGKVE